MKKLFKYINPYFWIKKCIYIHKKNSLLKSFLKVGSLETDFMHHRIITPERLKIGRDVFMGEGIYISAKANISDRVMFGPQCMIIGGDHLFGVIGKYPAYLSHPIIEEAYKLITIEEDVWCGARTLILKNVKIGKGAVIGAGSVVVKDIPPYTVAVGNPCKPVRKIFSDEDLKNHLLLLKYDKNEIEQYISERNTYFPKGVN